ncbi:MAG: hypothetical protein LBE80_08165, partial [Deltaproteobacteria bacterium]|nr:hypothetical protein [Deltaproteobacteria bacterium]
PTLAKIKKTLGPAGLFLGEVKRLAKVIKAVQKKPATLGLKKLGFMGQIFFLDLPKKFRPV